MILAELTRHLRELRGVKHKLDLRPLRGVLGVEIPAAVPVGDDCAAIPDGDGFLLFAIEGMLDEFVAAEPWFAGYCAVMVNVSDIFAMGGRPIAVVDAIWSDGSERANPIWEGMTAAAAKYGVPIVGGHTNTRSTGGHLAVAILGRAHRLLTSFDAQPGDDLVAVYDLRGEWFGSYPYWNASTSADGQRLRADVEILPTLAEDHLCAAAKDISMGGIIGTAAMLADCSGIGMTIDISAIPAPAGAATEKWLSSFPSYGYLLATRPAHTRAVCDRFAGRGLSAARIGSCDDTRMVKLSDGHGATDTFWDLNRESFIGFGPNVG